MVEVDTMAAPLMAGITRRSDLGLACAALLLLCCSGPLRAEEAASAHVQALVQQGKLDEALSAADAELGHDASSVTFRFLKGSILTRMNRLDEAAAIFQKLIDEHPELPEPYNNLAVVYAAQGDYERARDALQKAINTHPSYATAHENLGDIYAKMASQAYNHALQLDQDNSSAKTKLALITDLFSMAQPHAAAIPPASAAEAKPPVTPASAAAAKPPEAQAPATEAKAPAQAANVAEAGAPAAAPAAAAIAAPAPAPGGSDEVRRTVEAWAAAWSAKDAATYLSYYADDFAPREGQTRAAWAEERKARIAAPRFIKVGVVNLEVAMQADDRAQASFLQDYQSDSFSDRIRKTLVLRKAGDRWLITQENLR